MKLGSILKGGEQLSRVDTLPRHHDDPSPPAPASPQKVCWSLRGCRDTAPSMGLPHRKAATTAATSYMLQELAQAPPTKKRLGHGCQQHPIRHMQAGWCLPRQRWLMQKQSSGDLGKPQHLQTLETSASRQQLALQGVVIWDLEPSTLNLT